jgi:lysophospholipase L1-like esterase
VPDWRSRGAGAALTLPYVNGPNGPEFGATPRLFVREIPLRPGKRLRSVTLPGPSTGPGALHVFSLGVRPDTGGWRGTWATAQHAGFEIVGRSETTVRIPVRTSVAGGKVRIRLSNGFSLSPVRFGGATVGLAGTGSALVPGSVRDLAFGGRRAVTVPAGGEAVSDPVDLAVPAQAGLVISLYLPGRLTHVSQHTLGLQTVYWTAPGAGDHSRDTDGASFTVAAANWPFLSAVDVETDRAAPRSVVVLGDSITDGTGSTPNANHRWTDHLSTRLGGRAGVLNAGITGNRLTDDLGGNPGAQDRLERDVLSQAGVRTMILFEGVNDLRAGASADEVIDAMTEIAARARVAGVRVVGGTVIPFHGWVDGGVGGWSPEKETNRLRVNEFVRDSGGVFDAVVDFDAALRDPAQPDRYNPQYDSGDHLHPNDAGMQVLADAVDLDALRIMR